jgi:uncharacterized membrane-anchored protein YitT (DUF2179 family)
MSKTLIPNEIKDYILIIFGSLFIALSIVLFFIPNNFTTGGTPGMAILLHNLTGFSVSLMVIAINTPLLILGTKYLGSKFALKTVITIVLMSLFINFFTHKFTDIAITHNILLASVFGGALIGLGVGLIIKGNASAGGSTIIARVLYKTAHIKPAKVMLVIDIIIVTCSIYIFQDIEKALWSIISIYATSKFIDMVLTGTQTTKVIHITTNKPTELSFAISNKLADHGTVLTGTGIKNNENKTVLFMVADVKKIASLKEIIEQTDEDAFMLVMEASEILGRGH